MWWKNNAGKKIIHCLLTRRIFTLRKFTLGHRKQGAPSPEILSSCRIVSLLLIWFLSPSAWVDVVWDLEFTEKKPMEDPIEEELALSRDMAFKTLYQCLLTHSADQRQPSSRDGSSQVDLVWHHDSAQGGRNGFSSTSTWNHLFLISFLFCSFSNSFCKSLDSCQSIYEAFSD